MSVDASDERDTLPTVVKRLQSAHNSALVVVHDDRTEHIGYWDKSERDVEALALAYVQEQGFRVIHAGRRDCRVTGQKQAWAEFRRRDPAEVYGSSAGESR
jgi:hypothetical protein